MNHSPQQVSFPALGPRELTAVFDGGELTSDAGLALLAAADRKLGISGALAQAFSDRRQPAKVRYPAQEIIAARSYAIACGYAEGNDFDRLRQDPGLETVCGHLPESTAPLASQEVISRFEHAPGKRELVAMGWALAELAIAQLPAAETRIRIDVDSYDDPCHGGQQLSLCNPHYGARCYLPLAVCVSGTDGVAVGGDLTGWDSGDDAGLGGDAAGAGAALKSPLSPSPAYPAGGLRLWDRGGALPLRAAKAGFSARADPQCAAAATEHSHPNGCRTEVPLGGRGLSGVWGVLLSSRQLADRCASTRQGGDYPGGA